MQFTKGAICPMCRGTKALLVRTEQGYVAQPCSHCGGAGAVVKGKK